MRSLFFVLISYASKATLKIDLKLEEEEIIEGIWAIALVVKKLAIARGWKGGGGRGRSLPMSAWQVGTFHFLTRDAYVMVRGKYIRRSEVFVAESGFYHRTILMMLVLGL